VAPKKLGPRRRTIASVEGRPRILKSFGATRRDSRSG
jgi:hypothetical protein